MVFALVTGLLMNILSSLHVGNNLARLARPLAELRQSLEPNKVGPLALHSYGGSFMHQVPGTDVVSPSQNPIAGALHRNLITDILDTSPTRASMLILHHIPWDGVTHDHL